MATKTDFTEAEWDSLHRGATGAGMLVSLSSPGFSETFKETNALAHHLTAARAGSQSQLVREIASEHGTGVKMTMHPDEMHTAVMTALTTSVATLQAKAPDELDAYRAFVLELAQSVAEAAHGVDAQETAAIGAIRTALGVTA